MGHANIENLSDLFINLLYAKGKLTINQAVEIAAKRGVTLHASEGEYDAESGMVGLGLEHYCSFLSGDFRHAAIVWGWSGNWDGPYIEPCLEIMRPQLIKHYKLWLVHDESIDEEWESTDEIPWRFCKGKRRSFKEIPRLSNITN